MIASSLSFVITLRKIKVLTFYNPAFSLRLCNIQVCYMKTILLLYPVLNLLISRLALRCCQIHFIHFDLHTDVILRSRKFGQQTYSLDVQRQ